MPRKGGEEHSWLLPLTEGWSLDRILTPFFSTLGRIQQSDPQVCFGKDFSHYCFNLMDCYDLFRSAVLNLWVCASQSFGEMEQPFHMVKYQISCISDITLHFITVVGQWCQTPLVPALEERGRQLELCESEARLQYKTEF